MNDNIYEENGYENRLDYLTMLSEEYNIPMEVIISISDVLGPDEDFDGLVSSLQEYESFFMGEM